MISSIDNDKPPMPPQYFERNGDFRKFGSLSLDMLTKMTAAEAEWKQKYSEVPAPQRATVSYSGHLACDGQDVLVSVPDRPITAYWRPSINLN